MMRGSVCVGALLAVLLIPAIVKAETRVLLELPSDGCPSYSGAITKAVNEEIKFGFPIKSDEDRCNDLNEALRLVDTAAAFGKNRSCFKSDFWYQAYQPWAAEFFGNMRKNLSKYSRNGCEGWAKRREALSKSLAVSENANDGPSQQPKSSADCSDVSGLPGPRLKCDEKRATITPPKPLLMPSRQADKPATNPAVAGLAAATRMAADLSPNGVPYPAADQSVQALLASRVGNKQTAALEAKPIDPPATGWSEAQKADLNYSMAEQLESMDGTCSGYLRAAALYTDAAGGMKESDARRKRAVESAQRLVSTATQAKNQGKCPESQNDSVAVRDGGTTSTSDQWVSAVKKSRLSFLAGLKSEIDSWPKREKRSAAIIKFQEIAKSLSDAPIPPKGSLREQALLNSARSSILGDNEQDMSSVK